MLFPSKHEFYTLLKLTIPLVLSGIAQSSVFFFETVFFAHLGEQELAAGALVTWFGGTLFVILFGTLSAINVLISHKHGANDQQGIGLVVRDGFLLALLLAIPLFILFYNIAPIFILLGQSQAIVALAQPYLYALAWVILPNAFMLVLLELLMGLGEARVILVFTTLSVIITIASSYLLIFGKLGFPALGISGAGWGMLISSVITAVIELIYLLWHKKYRVYFKSLFKWVPPCLLWELLKVGVPMGIMFCIEVGFFFVLTLLMGHLGSQLMAANQIALQYLGMLMSMIFSLAQAITVRMGHLLGAKQRAAAERAAYAGFLLSVVTMTLVALCFWTMPQLLIAIDFSPHDPKNQEIINYAKQILAISAVFQWVEALRISLFGALRSLKDTHFTLIVSIVSFWGIALPTGYLLATVFQLGGAGFWWGMVLSASLSVIVLLWRFNLKMRKANAL